MSLRKYTARRAMQLFRSSRGQRFLDRVASRLDFWRGYGAGAYLESSGEAVLFDLVRKRTPPSEEMIIFDIGANVGDFSAAALDTIGPKISIHAFEPAQEVFATLSRRFSGNDRIILNNVALGREAGARALFGINRDSGMASLVQRKLDSGEKSAFQEHVKVIRLSDYCLSAKIERINLLKMDVEGLELEVLAGAEPLFAQGRIDICSFEFGGCNLDSRTYLRDFFEFFEAREMEIFRITPGATIVRLPRYYEALERFMTTNYVAVATARKRFASFDV